MKFNATIISMILLISSSNSFCQAINLEGDSLKNLLCKQWKMDYAIMGGMRIDKMPGAAETNFEFKNDGTFIQTTNISSQKTKGGWSYDKNKKVVKLISNGKSNFNIISLKKDELIMLADTKQATPDDPTPIQIVYKVISE
ncbi:MAG TPA: lipocalin family protein [Puia sp.]|nr:lipocalin family protein [Puia sp.]